MIYTFYSYKGGVGRSMALANVAECFHAQGLRVLIVDWDLEAPGLETYFFERTSGPDPEPAAPLQGTALVESSLGLMDLLLEYKRSFNGLMPPRLPPAGEQETPRAFKEVMPSATPPEPAAQMSFGAILDQHLPPITTYLFDVHPGNETSGDGQRRPLRLLPSGWRHRERFAAYAQSVQSFDWDGFYTHYRGKEFFDWLRDRLLALADVVLIDSRTGVTEMGGVCARQLADVVVSFSAPNNQNIEGVVRMTESFKRPETLKARDMRALETVIVPTRVDSSELDDLKRFEQHFRRLTERGAENDPEAGEPANGTEQLLPRSFRNLDIGFWQLQIPYRAKFAYHERRVIGPGVVNPDSTHDGLEQAYWRLADHLALLSLGTSAIRQAFAGRLSRTFPNQPKTLLVGMPDALELTAQWRAGLLSGGIELAPEFEWSAGGMDVATALAQVALARQLVLVASPLALDDAGMPRRMLRFARQRGCPALWVGAGLLNAALPPWARPFPCEPELNARVLRRVESPPRPLRSPAMVPLPPPAYVERVEPQEALKTALLAAAAHTGEPVLALHGPAGIGKTALVARLCQDDDLVDAYAGGIYAISAGDAQAGQRIVDAVQLPSAATRPAAGLAQAAELLSGRRTLVVVDDIGFKADAERHLALVRNGTTLFITRDAALARELSSETLALGSVSHDEARAFLPGADTIAARLGGWPLALSIVRRALQETSASDVAAALASDGVVAFDRPGLPRDQSVSATIESVLKGLQEWQRRRFEQLVEPYANKPLALSAVTAEWARRPGSAGEPSPFERRQARALCETLSRAGLIALEAETQQVTLPSAVLDYLRAEGMLSDRRAAAPRPADSSGEDAEVNVDVAAARDVLAGRALAFEPLLALTRRLKAARYFHLARRLFARLRGMPEASARALYLAQQQALCTYKDTELPTPARFERALEILAEREPLDTTTDQETLGLAGAIHKYWWIALGRRQALDRSLAFYQRGCDQGPRGDEGYTAINAAFLQDQIAWAERAESLTSDTPATTVAQRQEAARQIRLRILEELVPLVLQGTLKHHWWLLVTLAEACFGLGPYDEARYGEARRWLREALRLPVGDWEFQSTAQQFAQLALLHNQGRMPSPASQAYRTLRVFLGDDVVALNSVAIGKVGLALSGGGFRAALFHIGVLARLAELDMLRHVEVLSCVSGGSVVGAHYYLLVKGLLEKKQDADIERGDYIALVQTLEVDFLAGVQTNLRTRLLANPWTNLRSALVGDYSRTDRLGELMEQEFFAPAAPGIAELSMDRLRVQPLGAPERFSPKADNWRRAAKVPVLILNAATLNTGHNWQFAATWMGEPPAGLGTEIDGNDLLRRMYYFEAPPDHRQVRLGRAVAASACVPGLFDPVSFSGLYPDRTVRLVDGGVHDNQGVGTLLEQECSVILVSDASGQSASLRAPGAGPLAVPLRASSIQTARVREAQLLDLRARHRGGQIRNLMFIHLKKDLEADPVNWVDCKDSAESSDDARPLNQRGPLTRYGVLKTVQRQLAALRTDLDSFSDAEAHALMLSGYRMTHHECGQALKGMPIDEAQGASPGPWRFLASQSAFDRAHGAEQQHQWLMKILNVGDRRFFRAWKLSNALWGTLLLAALLLGGLAVRLWPGLADAAALAWQAGAVGMVAVVLFLLVSLLLWGGFRAAGTAKPLAQIVTGLGLGLVGWVIARLHLWIVDPGYLALGRASGIGHEGRPKFGSAWRRPLLLLLALCVALVAVYAGLVWTARASQAQGDNVAAIANWNRVLSVVGSNNAYLARAQARVESGAYALALEDFDRALSEGADPLKVYPGRAMANFMSGSYAAAVADYEQIPADRQDEVMQRTKAEALRALNQQQAGPMPASAVASGGTASVASPRYLNGQRFEVFFCPTVDPSSGNVAERVFRVLLALGGNPGNAPQPLTESDWREFFKPLTQPLQIRMRTDLAPQVALVDRLLGDATFNATGLWQRTAVVRGNENTIRLLACHGPAARPAAAAAASANNKEQKKMIRVPAASG